MSYDTTYIFLNNIQRCVLYIVGEYKVFFTQLTKGFIKNKGGKENEKNSR